MELKGKIVLAVILLTSVVLNYCVSVPVGDREKSYAETDYDYFKSNDPMWYAKKIGSTILTFLPFWEFGFKFLWFWDTIEKTIKQRNEIHSKRSYNPARLQYCTLSLHEDNIACIHRFKISPPLTFKTHSQLLVHYYIY